MSNIVNKNNSIVKKENIESECTKNREETKNKSGKEIKVKICPISYDELGENGEYILKDDDGYCFNSNSVINKNTGHFRQNMNRNPMNRKEWSKSFKKKLKSIPRRIKMKLIRKNGSYWVEGEENPCCTECKRVGCISNCLGRASKCNTCDEDFKPTKRREPCEPWILKSLRRGRGSRKKKARKKRGSKKKGKRHRKKNTKKTRRAIRTKRKRRNQGRKTKKIN